MSRTFNEHHPTTHNPKNRFPSPYKDDDHKEDRKRKMKPYGSKGHCKVGGEVFFKKSGDCVVDVVNKGKFRQASKNIIKQYNEEDE